MSSDSYPFSDQQKLFEQNGWLKAELERLRGDMVREADLLRLEKRLEAFIISRDEERSKTLMGELDRAFERGIPGTQQLVQREVMAVQERQAKEFEESLVKAGLERKEDGTIAPKVHPIRKAIVRNVNIIMVIILVAAAANPEQAIGLFRLALTLVF
jgi:hypothetical protein